MPQPQLRQAFGQHLREARLATGLQQKDVAQALGVNPSVVNRWESGVHAPEPKRINDLAAVLDLDAADLGARLLAATAEEAGQLRRQNSQLQADKRYLTERIDEMLASNDRLSSLLERLLTRDAN